MNKEIVDTSNLDPNYWEKILAADGMPENLPKVSTEIAKVNKLEPVSFEQEFEHVKDMQENHDDKIKRENLNEDFPNDPVPPCIALKMDLEERGVKKY